MERLLKTSPEFTNLKNVSLITDGEAESEVAEPLANAAPVVTLKSKAAALDRNGTAGLSDVGPSAPIMLDVTMLSNATATESDLPDINDPKR